jgi:multiple sugar transport system permease protein
LSIKRALFFVLIGALFISSVAPFAWQLIASLKDSSEIYSMPVTYVPAKPTLNAYIDVFNTRPFLRYIVNSLLVSLGTTSLCLVVATLAAYSLARLRIRYQGVLSFSILAACLFPQIIFLIPLYQLMAWLRLVNNPLGLLLPYVTFSLPLAVWVLMGFFTTIPREIEEQAMVDGFGRLGILTRIVLPLSWPALATCAILIFIGPFAWNEFIFALTFMTRDLSRTVPVGIALLSGTSMYEIPWNQICAACVLTAVPLVIFVVIFQRRIIEGLTRGALKG